MHVYWRVIVDGSSYRRLVSCLCRFACSPSVPQLLIPADALHNVTYRTEAKDDGMSGVDEQMAATTITTPLPRDVYMPINTYGSKRPIAGGGVAAGMDTGTGAVAMATDSPGVAPMAASPEVTTMRHG